MQVVSGRTPSRSCLDGWFVEIDLGVVEIVSGVFEDEGAVFFREFAAQLGGYSGPQCAGRHNGVFGDNGTGGNDGTGPNAAIIQDACANADKAFIFNDTPVDSCIVADGHPVAHDDRVEVALTVEHGAVLYVGVGADADGVDVSAEDRVHPDGGVRAESNIANELGGEIDIAGVVNLGSVPLVGTDHG
jgi:hypothetical protein